MFCNRLKQLFNRNTTGWSSYLILAIAIGKMKNFKIQQDQPSLTINNFLFCNCDWWFLLHFIMFFVRYVFFIISYWMVMNFGTFWGRHYVYCCVSFPTRTHAYTCHDWYSVQLEVHHCYQTLPLRKIPLSSLPPNEHPHCPDVLHGTFSFP